jgi:hypothetical protein
MTIGPIGQCEICINRFYNVKGVKCEAFTENIPDEIYFMEHFHTIPFKGDNGVLFKLDKDSLYKDYLPAIIKSLKSLGMNIEA